MVQKGLSDSTCAFIWDKHPTTTKVVGEVKRFWYSEKMLKNNIQHMLEDASAQDIDLPDDIMP
jgi:hypothetical protein